jgi:hypothetical protein
MIISDEELRAAARRIAAREAAPAKGFQYSPRSREQWQARANQTREVFKPAPATPIQPATNAAPALKPKINNQTLCGCGHRRDAHCLGDPRLHTPEGSGAGVYCTTEHCEASRWNGEEMKVCACVAFQVFAGAPVKQKHPKADAFTPCASCGHWRGHHCKVRRPSKAKKPKARDWEGFEVDGQGPFRCKHVPVTDPAAPFRCDSTSCAEGDEVTGNFCPCKKFVNPLAKPRESKRKSQTLAEVRLEIAQIAVQL